MTVIWTIFHIGIYVTLTIILVISWFHLAFYLTALLSFYRDKQKEESRKRKLETYKETGSWPGAKPKLRKSAESAPWSKNKEKKAKKHEKMLLKSDKKKKGLSETEIALMEKSFTKS